MGTILYAHGVDSSIEALNVTLADQIRKVHEAYIHAGAEVIQTNTYGANYIKLARHGLAEQGKKNNQKAVEIAKQASQDKAYDIGNIGGTHGGIKYTDSQARNKRSFREQPSLLVM